MKTSGFFGLNLVLFSFISSFNAYSDVNLRRQKILKIIDEEISEVNNLINTYQNKNPNLLFRKAELYLEKGRVTKDGEIDRYMDLPFQKRRSLKKSRFFTQSNKLFRTAKSVALSLTKRFPRYKLNSSVFYILGFNEKEIGSQKKAERYFVKALKYSKKNKLARVRAQNALAEIYFNQKKYRKSIRYYEASLKDSKDRWWTKDAFNLAWSYLRVKQYDRALSLIKEVAEKSKSSRYIDMSSSVNRDIGLFFAESGRIEEGFEYFKAQNKNYVLELITLATFLRQSGRYTEAMTILNEALKLKMTTQEMAKIRINRIELFDRYDRVKNHLSDCVAIYKDVGISNLTEDQKEIYKYQIKKQIAVIQKQIDSPAYRKSPAVKRRKVKQVATYLSLLKRIEPGKSHEHYFYKAETYYQSGDYDKAYDNYELALNATSNSKDSQKQQIRQRSLEGLLALAALPVKRYPKIRSRMRGIYTTYLRNSNNEKNKKEIYKKLFKLDYDKSDHVGMKKTLEQYNGLYRNDRISIEKMINSLLSTYEKKGLDNQTAALLSDISSGKYRVSPKMKSDVYNLSKKLEIKKIENLVSKGSTKDALTGYQTIYSDPQASKIAKANAAYNAMVLNFKSYRLQATYDWGVRAIELMSVSSFIQRESSFLAVSKYFFDRLQYRSGADISHRALGKVCGAKAKYKNAFFKNAASLYRAGDQTKQLDTLKGLISACKLTKQSKNHLYTLLGENYLETKNIAGLARNMSNFPAEDQIQYAVFLNEYYEKNLNFSQSNRWKRDALSFYKNAIKRKTKLSGKSLDAISKLESKKLNEIVASFKRIKLAFPEDRYTGLVQKKFGIIEQAIKQAEALQKIGSGEGIVNSFKSVIDLLNYFYSEIDGFVPPQKSAEYVASFQKSMKKVLEAVNLKRNQVAAIGKKTVKTNDIMVINSGMNELGFDVFESEIPKFIAHRRGQ